MRRVSLRRVIVGVIYLWAFIRDTLWVINPPRRVKRAVVKSDPPRSFNASDEYAHQLQQLQQAFGKYAPPSMFNVLTGVYTPPREGLLEDEMRRVAAQMQAYEHTPSTVLQATASGTTASTASALLQAFGNNLGGYQPLPGAGGADFSRPPSQKKGEFDSFFADASVPPPPPTRESMMEPGIPRGTCRNGCGLDHLWCVWYDGPGSFPVRSRSNKTSPTPGYSP